ncbi:Serine/threonine protein kinase, partial [Globisporangium splendens]
MEIKSRKRFPTAAFMVPPSSCSHLSFASTPRTSTLRAGNRSATQTQRLNRLLLFTLYAPNVRCRRASRAKEKTGSEMQRSTLTEGESRPGGDPSAKNPQVVLASETTFTSVNSKTEHGRTPLSHATAGDTNSTMAQVSVAEGVSVDEKDEKERTLLAYAAARGDSVSVDILIAAGASVDEKDEAGRTPLCASIDGKDKRERTPLHYAASSGDNTSIQLLISAGATIDQKDKEKRSPLSYAAARGDRSSMQLLMSAGASVDVKDEDGRAPLLYAVKHRDHAKINDLIDAGAALDEKDSEGRTPLCGTLKTMRELCETSDEFGQVLCGVLQRLDAICSLLENGLMDHSPDVIVTFTTIVFRFCRMLFQLGKSAGLLSRFITSATYLHKVREFHEELDHFAELQNLVQNVGSWKDQWPQAEASACQRIYERLQTDKDLLHGLDKDEDKYDVLVRLDHEIQKRTRGATDPTVVRNFEHIAARLADACTNEAPRAPAWFIPSEDVETDEENGAGKWAKIQVMICSVYEQQHIFQDRASRWHQLSHPNVQKLFGACHINQPLLFICEYGERMLDALESQNDDQQLVWKYLRDAALGVQYLHQRGIVHGDLRCENIVIGSDEKAKIRGLFVKVDDSMFITDSLWTSPEVRIRRPKKSLASDIYALGMCIVEAATPKQDRTTARPVRLYDIRPQNMSDSEWDLVMKMCAFEPAERVRIAYVVHHLEQFATNESMSPSVDEGSPKVCNEFNAQVELANIEDEKLPGLRGTIPEMLQNIQRRCALFPESPWMSTNVYPALEFAFERLKVSQKRPSDIEVQELCSCLSEFERYVRTAVPEKSVARAARSRQVAESHYVIYEKLDRLLDCLSVNENDPIRRWKRSQASIDGRLWGNNIESQTEEGEKESEAVSLARFASPDNPVDGGPTSLPAWYLPFREPTFSEGDKLGEVVKLYGACHIDKRYFVCEYAPNGDLSAFSKRVGNVRLVWEKLHQAALGLEYVHSLNIAHNDLKCDNILIGMDGSAKLIDFGLSAMLNEAEVMIDVERVGAVHWKSPEYLAGERPSLASDVYSFAMCVLETVTGVIPWGSNMLPNAVKYHVKKGKIPKRPAFMSDKQWNLVELMTKTDSSQRVNMSYVVNKLFEISEFEKSVIAFERFGYRTELTRGLYT